MVSGTQCPLVNVWECDCEIRPDLGYKGPDMGSERPDLGSGRPDLGSKRPDLRS